jgi:hypothetical protein
MQVEYLLIGTDICESNRAWYAARMAVDADEELFLSCNALNVFRACAMGVRRNDWIAFIVRLCGIKAKLVFSWGHQEFLASQLKVW